MMIFQIYSEIKYCANLFSSMVQANARSKAAWSFVATIRIAWNQMNRNFGKLVRLNEERMDYEFHKITAIFLFFCLD